MLQIFGHQKRSMSVLMMIAQLLHAQAGEHQQAMQTDSQPSPYIGHTITNKDGIAQIQAQFITCTQQHPWPWFATGTMLFPSVGTIIDFFDLPPILDNTGHHATVNLLHRLSWDRSLGYTCLVRANHNTMTGLSQLSNCFTRTR